MKQIRINDLAYMVPSSWNELTKEQALRFVELIQSGTSLADIKIKLVLYITGIKVHNKTFNIEGEECFQFKYGRRSLYISAEQILDMANTMEFLFNKQTDDNGNNHYYPDSKLTKNLLPTIKIKGKELYGPDSGMVDLIMEEYIYTETNYMHYVKTHNLLYLDTLISILYRPCLPITPGVVQVAKRVPFHTDTVQDRVQLISTLDICHRELMLLWYIGCRDFLAKRFPNVFKTGSTQSRKETNTYIDMMELVSTIAGNDPTKNEAVRQTLLYDVMVSLNNMNKPTE